MSLCDILWMRCTHTSGCTVYTCARRCAVYMRNVWHARGVRVAACPRCTYPRSLLIVLQAAHAIQALEVDPAPPYDTDTIENHRRLQIHLPKTWPTA